MHKDPQTEPQWRADLASVTDVKVHLRPYRDDLDSRDIGRVALPLLERQVGDLVTVRRQPLGQVSVPAFCAANGPRKETVVNQADAHLLWGGNSGRGDVSRCDALSKSLDQESAVTPVDPCP